MKKFRIILLFSIFIIRIPFLLDTKSKYTNEEIIEGIINHYQIDGNKLSLEIIAKEKILAHYYFKTEEEKKFYEEKIELGLKIIANGNLKKPSSNRNFNLFNYQTYLKSKKIYWLFEISSFQLETSYSLKYAIKNKIIKKIRKSYHSDYLNLFILGQNNLEENVNQSFQWNGINHLFAVSGMHITFLTSLLLLLLNKLFHNERINFLFICFFLFFYMFLINYTPSVIRASFFFILLHLKKIFKWKISNCSLLFLLLLILFNINPYYIYNAGFLYSFIISLGLIYFTNQLKSTNYIKTTFKISLISFLLSLPIHILVANQINLISPFINLLFVPFITFIVFPCCLFNFIIPLLNPIIQYFILLLENLSIFLAKITIFTITLKTPPIYIIILYYLLIIWIIKKLSLKRSLLLILLLIIHTNIKYFQKYPVLTVIDVGQGDSILIELPNNKTILVDTGGKMVFHREKWQMTKKQYGIATDTIIPYLKSRGIKKIDFLILTHGDYDHLGEAISLVDHFKVNYVFMNRGNENKMEQQIKKLLNNKNIPFLEISQYHLTIDTNQFYFLNPKNSLDENEDSLIIYTKLNGKNILLMGDAGKETERNLICEYNLPNMDILKVGHHGSKNSSSKDFITYIKPKISLISAGINNQFGHPNRETLDILTDVDSKIYSTNQHGMIRLILKNQIKVETVF